MTNDQQGDDHDATHDRDPQRLAGPARGPPPGHGAAGRPGGHAGRSGTGRPDARPARGPGGTIRPGRPAPGRNGNGRYPGDDDRSQASGDIDDQEEDPPTDGRQLLGWAAKQVPDAKGRVIGYGKKRGFPGRIVDWKADQVDAAYRFARSWQDRARR